MFSTYDGAKKCASALKRLFEESGFLYPLHKCQHAAARAGGYRDWNHLRTSMEGRERRCDAEQFRQRLIAALPEPCHAPVRAWLDREPPDRRIDPDVPARWYRDVFPYLFASAVLHRTETGRLVRGSGVGQQLRQRLVVGLLMNEHGGHRPFPRLDPETLALIFDGSVETLYGNTVRQPRFTQELAGLVDAGILAVDEAGIRVFPPDRSRLAAKIADRKLGLVQHWFEIEGSRPELANALREALAGIGVDNALRVALAIADQGSAAYTVPNGAALTCLSDLAKAGRMDSFARAFDLFAAVLPGGAAAMRDWIPAQIMSAYIGAHLRVPMGQAMAWTDRNRDWAHRLKSVAHRPAALVNYVASMVEEMQAA